MSTASSDSNSTADGPSARERNLLLEALPASERERLLPMFEHVVMPVDMLIYEADGPIDYAYFPLSGVISMVSAMTQGTVEVGTVGREGMAGLPLVLRAERMPTRAFVQVEGAALRISADDFKSAMRTSGPLEDLLFKYALSLFDQTAQSAACNRLHSLEERCARWLLMTHDRVRDDELPLKQTFLAQMLGVHRPAVTLAAGALQKAGIIKYTRGKVTIIDREALERASCECYRITQRSMARIVSPANPQ